MMVVDIKSLLGYDDEERVKLEAGTELIINKFKIHQGKKFKTARIDATVKGKEIFYYSAGIAIVSALEKIEDAGFTEPFTARTVMKKSVSTGYPYICFE